MKVLIQKINDALPQTQCGECGFNGCLPYAQALAQRSVPIDRCPPGGVDSVQKIAALLDIDPQPFAEAARQQQRLPAQAFIHEGECIGCTKCIQACPVDAIIGSAKHMHTILSTECTGCGLCVDPCPVDCIEMLAQESPSYSKVKAQERFQAKKIRAIKAEHEKQQAYREKTRLANIESEAREKEAKQRFIMDALNRVRQKNG